MPVIVAANTKGAEISFIHVSYADKRGNCCGVAIFAYFIISHLPEKISPHLHTVNVEIFAWG